jgi:hypothetical protein
MNDRPINEHQRPDVALLHLPAGLLRPIDVRRRSARRLEAGPAIGLADKAGGDGVALVRAGEEAEAAVGLGAGLQGVPEAEGGAGQSVEEAVGAREAAFGAREDSRVVVVDVHWHDRELGPWLGFEAHLQLRFEVACRSCTRVS